MIDLHTHTTASDGRCAPEELVGRAKTAGVTVLGLADHDTVAGCAKASAACAREEIEFVPGIEITAIAAGVDVHVLGYFIDTQSMPFLAFLAEQRRRRVERVREMADRLSSHGIQLDIDEILRPGLIDSSTAVGRPWLARALVARGYVATVGDAFNRWLSQGRPAFVPRLGAPPEEVFVRIHDAHGLASLAHPGLLHHDDWIPDYAGAGLDAIEAYHTDHDGRATARYLAMARSLNMAVTGGSDFHGDEAHGGGNPGRVSLPRADYDRLRRLHATRRAIESGSDTSSKATTVNPEK